ncbi:hypothetical protein N7454_003002 [Penicillium verhagenii]|nr:hypothetical protein N7454_003002 [Penicillium verhagenii]
MDPTAANIKDGSLEKYSGKKVLIVTSVLIPLQLLCVTLRCYVRYRSKISFGLDDTVVGLAMLGQLAWAGVIIGAIKNSGMGYHTLYLEQLNPSLIISASKYRTAEAFLYIPNANMPKISILLLYRRIFATHTLRVACDIFIAILVADIVICTVVLFFMCRPFAANWDPTIPGAKCMDIVAIYTWGSLPNIISDVAILLFPMPAVWSLQTILRTKFQLTITFALSSL